MSQNEQMIAEAMRYAISQLPGASEILKIKAENEKLTELQEDNERLQEELEGKEVLAKAYKEHKIEIMKLKKEVSRHRIALGNSDEENKKLKQKNEAVSKVNMFLSIQWKELKTNQNLAEMSGLGMDIGTDIAIVNIADEFVKLKEENKKLKEDELTEESAIEYVYNHTDQYEDWIEGSTIYEELKEENKKLKDENKELKEQNEGLNEKYGDLKERCDEFPTENEMGLNVCDLDEIIKVQKDENATISEELERHRIALGNSDEENKELRLWVERNQEEIDRLREVIDGSDDDDS